MNHNTDGNTHKALTITSRKEYLQLKKRLKQQKKLLKTFPRIKLKEDGSKASVDSSELDKVSLFFNDIQHVLAFTIFGPYLKPYNDQPRWCTVQKYNQIHNIVLLIVNNTSENDYLQNKNLFEIFDECDGSKVSFLHCNDGTDFLTDLIANGLSIDRQNALPNGASSADDVNCMSSISSSEKETVPCSTDDNKFDRRNLLLSLYQMVMENFPVPVCDPYCDKRFSHYRMTKDKYEPVTERSPIFAIDCEMCITKEGHELTRFSMVNEQEEVIYDSLVKPFNPIVHYKTVHSGIREGMLDDVDVRLTDVQNFLTNFLPPDSILAGHSLNCDLQVLRMIHPYVIDTSVIYNISGFRTKKPKLKLLAATYLNMNIQTDKSDGHCSVEDSVATMRLVKKKLSEHVDYGDEAFASTVYKASSNYPFTNNVVKGDAIIEKVLKSNLKTTLIVPQNLSSNYESFTCSDTTFQLFTSNKVKQQLNHARISCTSNKLTAIAVDKNLTDADRRSRLLHRLSNWCIDIWNNQLVEKDLLIVIFTSKDKMSRNVFMANIKKPKLE